MKGTFVNLINLIERSSVITSQLLVKFVLVVYLVYLI